MNLFLFDFPLAYGRVFLVRKLTRHDAGKLYAMKVLNKITVVQKRKTAEHTKTERVVSKKKMQKREIKRQVHIKEKTRKALTEVAKRDQIKVFSSA